MSEQETSGDGIPSNVFDKVVDEQPRYDDVSYPQPDVGANVGGFGQGQAFGGQNSNDDSEEGFKQIKICVPGLDKGAGDNQYSEKKGWIRFRPDEDDLTCPSGSKHPFEPYEIMEEAGGGYSCKFTLGYLVELKKTNANFTFNEVYVKDINDAWEPLSNNPKVADPLQGTTWKVCWQTNGNGELVSIDNGRPGEESGQKVVLLPDPPNGFYATHNPDPGTGGEGREPSVDDGYYQLSVAAFDSEDPPNAIETNVFGQHIYWDNTHQTLGDESQSGSAVYSQYNVSDDKHLLNKIDGQAYATVSGGGKNTKIDVTVNAANITGTANEAEVTTAPILNDSNTNDLEFRTLETRQTNAQIKLFRKERGGETDADHIAAYEIRGNDFGYDNTETLLFEIKADDQVSSTEEVSLANVKDGLVISKTTMNNLRWIPVRICQSVSGSGKEVRTINVVMFP